MSLIQYNAPLNVLLAVKGHPFDRNAFYAIFDDMPGVSAAMVDHPAAAQLMTPEGVAPYDALVLYDMPGLDFSGPSGPRYVAPPEEVKQGLRDALDEGIGVVAVHHAIAAWPDWAEYGEWLGGRFLYRTGEVRGQPCPDSGYRHDVRHQVEVVRSHPVTEGVPATFELTDELYLFDVFEEDVTPLLRSNHAFTGEAFYSAEQAVAGRMFSNAGWTRTSGSRLVGWVKRARRSPLVYLQPGDGPEAYANPTFRTLIENAIRWTSSRQALDWARQDGPE